MKNNLFVYGCSYTRCFECNEDHIYKQKYKKSEDDTGWPDIIAKKFDLNLYNYGAGLNSNDKIFDSIINSFSLIKENDIVIIERTFNHRYDIPDLDNKQLITMAPNPENLLRGFWPTDSDKAYTKKEIEHLTYMSVLMESDLLRERYKKRFEFIQKVLIDYKKVKKCIVWDLETVPLINSIYVATNGLVEDHHWSFQGCKDFSELILEQL